MTSTITPTREVKLSTVVAALVGLAAWLLAELAGVQLPAEVVAGVSTLAVGLVAYVTGSAKVTAGTLAAATITVLTFVLDGAGLTVTPEAAAMLTTVALFTFAWSTSE